MNEDTEQNGGRRRIIIRRRGSGSESGSTGTNTGTVGNGNGNVIGTDNASTNSGRNGEHTISDTNPTDEPSGDDRVESEGMYSAPGTESERTGSNGSGGNGERDEQFLSFGSSDGTDPDSGRSTTSRGNGTQGKPKRTYRKRQTSKGSLSLEQDTEDVKNIVIALGDAGSNATGYDGFTISEPEALSIAKPAARILQRHGAVAETIRTVADPLSLIIATASVFGPRLAGYKMYKTLGVETQYEERQQTVPSQPNIDTPRSTVTKEESFARIDHGLFDQFQEN